MAPKILKAKPKRAIQQTEVKSENGEESGFKCPQCSFRANTFDYIGRHVKRKHEYFYHEFFQKYTEQMFPW